MTEAKGRETTLDRMTDMLIAVMRDYQEAVRICEAILGDHNNKDVEQVYAALTRYRTDQKDQK
ncbi:MAG: hypothetical protein KF826_03390 [Xanthobacteraceae bacterium]|nr:hypothetical protein [Xanthobacteraceae bacterium]MCW5679658.1 hypothetical protein [Xanthobacteraceae bacterium]